MLRINWNYKLHTLAYWKWLFSVKRKKIQLREKACEGFGMKLFSDDADAAPTSISATSVATSAATSNLVLCDASSVKCPFLSWQLLLNCIFRLHISHEASRSVSSVSFRYCICDWSYGCIKGAKLHLWPSWGVEGMLSSHHTFHLCRRTRSWDAADAW